MCMCIETKILSLQNASKKLRKFESLKGGGGEILLSSHRHACTIASMQAYYTLMLFWIFLFVCPGVMDMRSKVFAGGRFTTLTALKLLSGRGDVITVIVHHNSSSIKYWLG